MLFNLNCDSIENETVFEKYAKFDTYAKEDWEKLCKENSNKEEEEDQDLVPVAYFEPDKEWYFELMAPATL